MGQHVPVDPLQFDKSPDSKSIFGQEETCACDFPNSTKIEEMKIRIRSM